MDEEIALEALKIPFLSTTIHDSGGENLDESDDVAELALKNRKCELTLCSVNIARTMSYSPDATDVMMLGRSTILNASIAHCPAMIALVLGMAGIMFFTTPIV